MRAGKRAPDSVAGQPDIQRFVGAIAGKHGDGLFVAAAKFSQKAKDHADTHHIILIDGERLAKLMNFCLSTRKNVEIKAVDTDVLAEYWDDETVRSQFSMSVKLYSLSDIFERRLFRISDYQRGYAWQRTNQYE